MFGSSANTSEEVLNRVHCEAMTGCWLWAGTIDRNGYGMISRGGRFLPAHRWSWTVHNGHLDPDLVIRHRCDTPACVNPDHLVPGTRGDNLIDAYSRGRRHQAKGSASRCAQHTEADAVAVRCLLGQGRTTAEVMAATGFNRDFVNRIKFRRGWRHAA